MAGDGEQSGHSEPPTAARVCRRIQRRWFIGRSGRSETRVFRLTDTSPAQRLAPGLDRDERSDICAQTSSTFNPMLEPSTVAAPDCMGRYYPEASFGGFTDLDGTIAF